MAFDFLKRFVSTPKPQAETEPVERRQGTRVRALLGSQVLVVDDSPTIRAVLGKMLVQDGYVVSKAPDGETAIALARSELPDLIFLDIVLPGMSGFEVLRTLRRDPHTKGTPIVMISGNLQATEQFYVQRFGADDFMKKPFGRAEVFERIRMLVEAGRMPGRPPDVEPVMPADISAEEWDAIPDIAMPDAEIGDAAAGEIQMDQPGDPDKA
jgi:twitching motility two-component system response regulator PilH